MGIKSKTEGSTGSAQAKPDLFVSIFAHETQFACKPVALLSGTGAGSIIASIP